MKQFAVLNTTDGMLEPGGPYRDWESVDAYHKWLCESKLRMQSKAEEEYAAGFPTGNSTWWSWKTRWKDAEWIIVEREVTAWTTS